MAGGNSHQKAVTKALEKRIEDRVIETVSRILGAAAPVEKEVPWYERGLFWGVFSTAITLVLMVIAAESKDIRWLLSRHGLVLSWLGPLLVGRSRFRDGIGVGFYCLCFRL